MKKNLVKIISIILIVAAVLLGLFFRVGPSYVNNNPHILNNNKTCSTPWGSDPISLEEAVSTSEGILHLKCILSNTLLRIRNNGQMMRVKLFGAGIDMTEDQAARLGKAWTEGEERFLVVLDSINNNVKREIIIDMKEKGEFIE